MAASNRTRPARAVTSQANGNGHANGNRSYVVLELSSDDVVSDERIPLFSIDGTEYTMPAEVAGNVGLQVTDIWATDGEAAGTKWLMIELLGEDGYQALRDCKTITKAQMRQVIQIMVKHALGDEDGPKAP